MLSSLVEMYLRSLAIDVSDCVDAASVMTFAECAIEVARGRGVELLREDLAAHVARSPGSHTVACAFQLIEHVSRPGEFLELLKLTVEPGGRIVFSVPAAGTFLGIQANAALTVPPHHLTWWRARAVARLARPVTRPLRPARPWIRGATVTVVLAR